MSVTGGCAAPVRAAASSKERRPVGGVEDRGGEHQLVGGGGRQQLGEAAADGLGRANDLGALPIPDERALELGVGEAAASPGKAAGTTAPRPRPASGARSPISAQTTAAASLALAVARPARRSGLDNLVYPGWRSDGQVKTGLVAAPGLFPRFGMASRGLDPVPASKARPGCLGSPARDPSGCQAPGERPLQLTVAGDRTTIMTTGTQQDETMILINIKMQIRPEKMDEWLRWPTPTPGTSTPRTAACSSSSPGVLPATASSSASRASPMPGRAPRTSGSPT